MTMLLENKDGDGDIDKENVAQSMPNNECTRNINIQITSTSSISIDRIHLLH